VVIVGVVATVSFSFQFLEIYQRYQAGVGIVLYTDVFSSSSKTAYFNHAVSLIRADSRCTKLLGTGSQISAHGEGSWSRAARNRFINDTTWTDKYGTEHIKFRFHVQGPLGQGVVHVHLIKRPSQGEYDYQELAVDVKGQKRVDLAEAEKKGGSVAPKIFGARWW
jgi:import inner membrane translocase subunit TIM21